MSVYRCMGSSDHECSNGHKYHVLHEYEYSSRKLWYEPTRFNGQWIPPGARTRSFLPMCPECGEAGSIEGMTVEITRGGVTNVQVTDKEAAAVAIHPVTGDEVYCFDRPDRPLPQHWADQGYVKVQFNHFRDLQRFCRDRGMVNDIEGDWAHDEGFFEEDLAKRKKVEKERRERYMAEREKVLKAYPELRKRERR